MKKMIVKMKKMIWKYVKGYMVRMIEFVKIK